MGSFLIRCYAGILFLIFSYLPLTFTYHAISQLLITQDGLDFYFFHLGLLLISGSLACFLFLLAYRAFSGKGRKKDGGLLPPLVMKIFIGTLFIVWMAALGTKIHEKDWITAIYIFVCLGAMIAYSYSKFIKTKGESR